MLPFQIWVINVIMKHKNVQAAKWFYFLFKWRAFRGIALGPGIPTRLLSWTYKSSAAHPKYIKMQKITKQPCGT